MKLKIFDAVNLMIAKSIEDNVIKTMARNFKKFKLYKVFFDFFSKEK